MSGFEQTGPWRCFHCNDLFTDAREARMHFGPEQCSEPGCKIKAGGEQGLLEALRKAEAELSTVWAAIHNESTESARAYYAQQSRHQAQIIALEQTGYDRGVADMRAYFEAKEPTP